MRTQEQRDAEDLKDETVGAEVLGKVIGWVIVVAAVVTMLM